MNMASSNILQALLIAFTLAVTNSFAVPEPATVNNASNVELGVSWHGTSAVAGKPNVVLHQQYEPIRKAKHC